jgi:hypothetical protein
MVEMVQYFGNEGSGGVDDAQSETISRVKIANSKCYMHSTSAVSKRKEK